MDESFRVRVDKVFGNLAPSSSSSLRSLWSLTDQEVEKREWNRHREESPDLEQTNPCSSQFDVKVSKLPRKSLQADASSNLEPGEGEEEGEEWDIRSSIGLDSTLDNEEEEDEFDKVAVGRENAGDRMYMKDITDYGPYLNAHNVVPESFNDHTRDPRANLLAAKNRLKEDEAVGSIDSDNNMPPAVDPQVSEEHRPNLKSILKRKESQLDSKPQKRVRFDPKSKDNCDELSENAQDSLMISSFGTTTTGESTLLPQVTSGIPDYVWNPSKYVRYSFDTSTEVDEESNRKAYMDFFNMIKGSKIVESSNQEGPSDLPKSITFIPKKKTGDAAKKKNSDMMQNQEEIPKESSSRESFPPGIVAIEAQENEACAMEEDEPETVATNTKGQKPSRQYRVRVKSDDSIS